VIDKHKNEGERGTTIYIALWKFNDVFDFTVIDAPGYRGVIKNMSTGTSQADVAVLFVPAYQDGIKAGIAKDRHSRKHALLALALLALTLGVKQMIVAVNKMDASMVAYKDGRYNEIKEEMLRILTKTGCSSATTARTRCPDLGGWAGDNMVEPSPTSLTCRGSSSMKTVTTPPPVHQAPPPFPLYPSIPHTPPLQRLLTHLPTLPHDQRHVPHILHIFLHNHSLAG
jgi:elongation factor 1-alpha